LRAEAHHERDARSVGEPPQRRGFGALGSDFAEPRVGRLSPPYGLPVRQSFAHQISHQCQTFDSVSCIAELHPCRRPSPNPDKVGSRVAAAQQLVEELLHHESLLLVQRSDRPPDGFSIEPSSTSMNTWMQ
jgi:hypothetical protein